MVVQWNARQLLKLWINQIKFHDVAGCQAIVSQFHSLPYISVLWYQDMTLPISPLLSGSARAEEQRACVLCSQSLTPSSWYQSPLLLLLMFWHCQNQLTVSSCKTSTSQQAHTHKHTPPPLSRTGPFLWASRFWYPQPLLVPLASGCTSSGRYFFLHYLSVPFALLVL